MGTLRQLNEVIRERLHTLNHKPFQKKSGSRASLFAEERLLLLPLPKNSFEMSTWKSAKVSFNYHIEVEGRFYSVPFEYIKRQVDVRTTRNMVEVFYEGTRVCSHVRLYDREKYSTQEAHTPPNHQQYVQWNGERFRKWAAKIGPNTVMVVESILTGYKIEQQGYPLKDSEARNVLEIAEARYKKAATIFCSQFDVGGWHQKIGEPTLADAICDCIVHDSYRIVIAEHNRDDSVSMRQRKGLTTH